MIHALLAAVSSVTPTATTVPTTTPLPVFVSIVDNTADKLGFWDLLGIFSSVILGVAALVISINAYNFAKKQQQREEEMRQREAKIAVIDKSFEIYNYFNNEIVNNDFFDFSDDAAVKQRLDRLNEIEYKAKYLFQTVAFEKIDLEIIRIRVALTEKALPDIKNFHEQYNSKISIYREFYEENKGLETEQQRFDTRKEKMLKAIKWNINKFFEEYKLNL